MGTRVLAVFLLSCWPAFSSPDATERAISLYRQTDYQGSLRILEADPAPDAAAYNLTGKNYFMLAEYKKATGFFEKATALAPANAENWLWLGRAYGRRAEMGTWLLAGINASKARQCFERAVALNPHYHEALNDLFDFYLEAPGFLGGGLDKAEAVAKRIGEESPAEYHFAEARIAERNKEYSAAEEQFRRAMETAPREVGRVIDLARYLAKRGRMEETETMFARAERMAPHDPRIAFARAKIYVDSNRNLEEARKLLRQYLESSLTPDDPPRQAAERLLRQAGGSASPAGAPGQ